MNHNTWLVLGSPIKYMGHPHPPQGLCTHCWASSPVLALLRHPKVHVREHIADYIPGRAHRSVGLRRGVLNTYTHLMLEI